MPITARDRIINTAERLFARHGFHAIGLDRILAEVGVTKTTFYKHFESKDDLIIAVLTQRDARELEEWLGIMRARGGEDPRARILALFGILEEWFASRSFRGCMFVNAMGEFPLPSDPIHKAAAAHGAKLGAAVRALSAQAGASDPDALAAQLMMIVAGALVSRAAEPGPAAATAARAAAELLLDRHLPVGARP